MVVFIVEVGLLAFTNLAYSTNNAILSLSAISIRLAYLWTIVDILGHESAAKILSFVTCTAKTIRIMYAGMANRISCYLNTECSRDSREGMMNIQRRKQKGISSLKLRLDIQMQHANANAV